MATAQRPPQNDLMGTWITQETSMPLERFTLLTTRLDADNLRRGNYTATRHDGSTLTGTYRFGETWLGPEFLSFDDTSTSPPDNVILSVEDLLAFYVRTP